jgi:site-specific DNA-adenine methylase
MSYQGGKQKLGKRIYKVIDTLEEFFMYDKKLTYLEPFVGFCGVIKHFGAENDRKLIGCDKNKDIILMWKALQKGWKPPITCTKKRYDELRYSKHHSAERGFIGIACSFSGIFFVGYRGTQTFKPTSSSKRSQPKIVKSASMTSRSLLKITDKIQNVNFKICDYESINPKNMLIYCDPPYKLNKYQQSEFFNFDSEKFWSIMRKWSKNNIVIISERIAPKDFKYIWKSNSNVIHHGKRNIQVEKLFVYESLYDTLNKKIKNVLTRY